MNKKKTLIYLIGLLLIISGGISLYFYNSKLKEEKAKTEHNKIIKEIENHYGKYVIGDNNVNLYIKEDDKYILSGMIGKNTIIELEECDIDYNLKYFSTKYGDNTYYINYNDVSPSSELNEYSNRYKKYLIFNENIITNDKYSLYDEDNNFIYSFNKIDEYPIIIKDNDRYGIEFNNRLLYINKSDIKEIISSKNTDSNNVDSIAVLNYHFFYDDSIESERKDCNQVICHSKTLFKSHLEYIKENNIFTLTLEEFEMWYDGKIKLPKSVVITIDDGWRMELGAKLLDEYELNGNAFLITKWWDMDKIDSPYKYVGYYSHGNDLHNQGVCSGGQGGAIKCKDKEFLLKDLELSKSKVYDRTFFCYPFYEYNSYSISVLKEAGFTMAFAGGGYKANKNSNRYAIPRYIVYNTTSVSKLASWIN